MKVSAISASAAVIFCIALSGIEGICRAEREFEEFTGYGADAAERLRCLYNGYFLTVDPVSALDAASKADRYRLYVLHAVLIDPDNGRIAAIYPSLPGNPGPGWLTAKPVSEYPDLLTMEHPPAPGVTITEIMNYWRAEGVDEELLTGFEPVDLQGAVVTPGMIDDHFHVTSWSKKIPAAGNTFGFWADVGDPAYYTDVETWGRVCVREALWSIVADANRHIAEMDKDSIYLHGYWFTEIDEPIGDDEFPSTFLYEFGGDCNHNTYNDVYLLNRIGRGPGAPQEPPGDPCNSDPSEWPPVTYESTAAVLVHTSGQACWYNSETLEAFNDYQENELGEKFDEVSVLSISPPSPSEDDWTVRLDAGDPDLNELMSLAPPYPIDIAVVYDPPGEDLYVPFQTLSRDAEEHELKVRPFIEDLAYDAFNEVEFTAAAVPFYRTIVECITDAEWQDAAEYADHSVSEEMLDYGDWDPREPHGTNWYNGAERGLIQYFHDAEAGVWRPSGYAEHYVMRDALSSFVIDEPTVEDCMEHRRRLADWCHRHGVTAVNDIMFYRRVTNTYEFESYEALSYDHGEGYGGAGRGYRDSVPTSADPFNLRVGLYYYIENAVEVQKTMSLAHSPTDGYDVERLQAPAGHSEYPGWVRWLGWKIQLDGGTGARTLCTNAPMAKARMDDSYETEDEDGNTLTFLNHSYGLLTMTNLQEQVFTSRETAALYWLVRESDPSSPHYNDALQNDWTFFKEGIVGFLNREISEQDLRDDLNALDHVELITSGYPPRDQPAELAGKLGDLIEQIQDGYERTLAAAAKIFYERSAAKAEGVPMPCQTVCHCIGDGAVDVWARIIRQLKYDVEHFPETWGELPSYWQDVIPEDADLSLVDREFDNERYRIEHILNMSCRAVQDIRGTGGIDSETTPDSRNVVFSVQPSLLALDGQSIRNNGFPYAQELWKIPDCEIGSFWRNLPWRPRSHHHMPCPLFMDYDIPFALDTDPPAVRDPRPVITLISAVARTPIEINPTDWVGKFGEDPACKPTDYLAGKVYGPLGLTTQTPANPMRLSVEQALSAMTFWPAYVSGLDQEMGAIAVPRESSESPGWFADMIIWKANPLGIRGPGGTSLETLGRTPEGVQDTERLATVNAFIRKFLPQITLIGGAIVWQLGVRMEMPTVVHAGDDFFVNAYIDNPGDTMTDVPVFFLMDIYGEYWFWPCWKYYNPPESEEIDYQIMNVPTGTTPVKVIPTITWPDIGNVEIHGLYFYGAMLNQEMNQIIGNWEAVEWGCEP